LPLFTTAARCDILLDALPYCRKKKALKIYAWCDSRYSLHAILSAADLSRVLADLKRHNHAASDRAARLTLLG
jgi:hypothetical protein